MSKKRPRRCKGGTGKVQGLPTKGVADEVQSAHIEGKRIGRVLWIRPGHWALQRVLSGTVVDSAVSIERSDRKDK